MEIPTNALFVFRATVVKVVDGDTIDVILDQGLNNTRTERLRVFGVDCPETNRRESREAGIAARDWVVNFLMSDNETRWPLIIQTLKDPDNFGRYIAHIWRVSDGTYLNTAVIEAGHAVAYEK